MKQVLPRLKEPLTILNSDRHPYNLLIKESQSYKSISKSTNIHRRSQQDWNTKD